MTMASRARPLPFLALLLAVSIGQAVAELVRGERPYILSIGAAGGLGRREGFEQGLHERSWVRERIAPWYRWLAFRCAAHAGAELALGHDGWLYDAAELEWVSRAPFLGGSSQAVHVILDLQRKLEALGIMLLVVPVPPKVSIDPEHLGGALRALDRPTNVATTPFLATLTRKGVRVIDVATLLSEEPALDHYLATDSRWTPATVARVSAAIASEIRTLPRQGWGAGGLLGFVRESVGFEGNLVARLRLPKALHVVAPEAVELEHPLPGWQRSTEDLRSPVLVVGDGFSGIFGARDPSSRAAAGLPEQLALRLRANVDAIVLRDARAASFSRILAERAALPHGRGGLGGKRVILWQFSLATLADGDPAWTVLAPW